MTFGYDRRGACPNKNRVGKYYVLSSANVNQQYRGQNPHATRSNLMFIPKTRQTKQSPLNWPLHFTLSKSPRKWYVKWETAPVSHFDNFNFPETVKILTPVKGCKGPLKCLLPPNPGHSLEVAAPHFAGVQNQREQSTSMAYTPWNRPKGPPLHLGFVTSKSVHAVLFQKPWTTETTIFPTCLGPVVEEGWML